MSEEKDAKIQELEAEIARPFKGRKFKASGDRPVDARPDLEDGP